ncbi:hypothetical protein AMTR_s00056p00226840 [Amborella trichopoda]|uniref:Uncharacterized protein n=1 Tax=Amborella trichopoda TaxID=13333 RepID=U5CZ74_AMBTC|nr:hypothetical protein AMTR_s00056p00226840 [Amborella trichopoda]
MGSGLGGQSDGMLQYDVLSSIPTIEELSWICNLELDSGSTCIERGVIDGLNIFFVVLFIIASAVSGFRNCLIRDDRARSWLFIAVAVLCAITSALHFGAGVWPLIRKKNAPMNLNWIIHLVHGLIWMVLAISLYIQRLKWVRILSLVWWVSFSLLVSAINVMILVSGHTLRILDLVSWPANLLLLLCSLQLFRILISQKTLYGNLSESLLNKNMERERTRNRIGFFSRLTFSWINPLLRLGHRKPLTLRDIPPLPSEDEAHLAYEAFSQAWEAHRKENPSSKSSVLKTLIACYFREMMVVGIYALVRTISIAVAPFLLYSFVEFTGQEYHKNKYQGLFLVGCLVVSKVAESLSQRHWFFDSRRVGMKMRSALMAAVYQKQLKLSSLARMQHSTGEIVNYIAVDAYRFGEFPWWFHTTWCSLLQLILAIVILFLTVGWGALPGLVPIIILSLLNIPIAKILQNCQTQFMGAQDERLRATSEILNNIKIIKLQAWEEKFRGLILSLRDHEFKWLASAQIKKSYGSVLYWMSPIFVSAVVFAGCLAMGTAPLNATTIFTVLVTLRVMSEPVRVLPEAFSILIQVKISLDRLDRFLLDDELRPENVKRCPVQETEYNIRICGGNFSWDPDSHNHTLRDVNLEVIKGKKVAVCGPVGAGKSSLLYAVLGEIPKVSGTVEAYGSIAYVAQTAWVQSGTVQDNILYGKPMNKTRYDEAIRSCALDKDLENFDHGDLTEIGERGLNLSGGQKQRIQLARAVYNDANIYLLDDPFSAVDAHTAAILFNDCVKKALAKKTVVLVTHQVEFLAEVDEILVLEGGQITQSGSYDDILRAGMAFEKLVNAHQEAMTALDLSRERNLIQGHRETADSTNGFLTSKSNSEGEISAKGISNIQLTEDEEMEIGNMGWKPYIDYISVSKGWFLFSSIIVGQCIFVLFQVASTYWLAIAILIPQISSGVVVGVYAIVSISCTFFVYLRSWITAHLGLRASKAFFYGFMDSVFRAPMSFFDSTPVGRILTRASSDMSLLDFDIPYSISFALCPLIELISTLIIMCTVTWQVLFAAIPVILITYYIQGYYQSSARELVRINGTTKAPVMNCAAETSLGVVTIRAFSAMERFIYHNLRLIDTDARLFFYTNTALEWVLLRVEALQNIVLFTATIFLVLVPPGTITPGFAGLSLSYALSLTSCQAFLTRWQCQLANYIISVERIKQFMNLPLEPPAIIDENKPPDTWPVNGQIDLQDLKIRYRPNSPLVLKGITCTFEAGKRVGVVGRTGSGKTTLISALFRLVDPFSGKILIDGLDICSIGLRDLRTKLSIIPQEPTLFKGTIRSNLDPLGLYSDHEIWEAIEKCQLMATIRSLPNRLDSSVSDEGGNWSAGQRQLFCLGRVLLRKNRILVLDEATASIDSATDAVLQKVIRKEFSNCTVITVAHRVPTVTDSDRVMVLSYGKLVEYDKPSRLMETNSSFAKLVAEYWANCTKNAL